MSRPTKSFWVSFPSILVGIEAVITAVTGLYVLLRERPPESNSKLVLKSPLKVRSLLNPEVDEVIRQTAENAGISVLIDGSVDQGSRDTLDQLRQTHESRRPDVAIGGSCQVYGTFTDWEEYLERIPDGFAAHQAISPHYVSEHWVGWYRGYLAFAYCRNKWDLDESMSWLDLIELLHHSIDPSQSSEKIIVPNPRKSAAALVLSLGLRADLEARQGRTVDELVQV